MSDEITGVQKVAAFLLSLNKDVSADLLRRLDSKVVPLVAQAMTDLRPELCGPDSVDEIYGDLARTVNRRAGVRAQDDYELHDILTQSFGEEEADRVLRDIHNRRRKNQPLRFLESMKPEVVSRVLNAESTAVVALVLAHVSPAVSAAVLNTFDEERALDIVKRMTSVIPPGIDTMLSIADNLQERIRLAASMPAPPDPGDSLRTIADLLNFSEGDTEKNRALRPGGIQRRDGRPGARIHVHLERPGGHRKARHAKDPGVGGHPHPGHRFKGFTRRSGSQHHGQPLQPGEGHRGRRTGSGGPHAPVRSQPITLRNHGGRARLDGSGRIQPGPFRRGARAVR